MAHNINDGRIFYVGSEGKPWHGIGVALDNPATAKEAIQAARLDYEVKRSPMPVTFRDDSLVEIPTYDRFGVYRSDTKQSLGIVGENYRIIQNASAFEFFDTVVGEGKAIYHTAGALGKGERIWILAKLPSNMVVGKNDTVEKYLLLTNSHDGKSSLRMFFTPIRVVCQNTLTSSLKDAKEGISIRHTGNIKAKVEEAQRVLGIASLFYSDFEEISNRMAEVKLDKKGAEEFFNKILFKGKEEEDVSTRSQNQRDELLALFENGMGNDIPDIKHSVWTAYNAVTEYADHRKTIRNVDHDPSLRLNSIWFGTGRDLKNRAYTTALEFAGVNRG
jgi:phage/plasmid-like protein (TIGR03299 family)